MMRREIRSSEFDGLWISLYLKNFWPFDFIFFIFLLTHDDPYKKKNTVLLKIKRSVFTWSMNGGQIQSNAQRSPIS